MSWQHNEPEALGRGAPEDHLQRQQVRAAGFRAAGGRVPVCLRQTAARSVHQVGELHSLLRLLLTTK